jgi:hypothetical protein
VAGGFLAALREASDERVGLFFSFFPSNSVALLDASHELVTLPGDHIEIVIGQFSPPLANLPLRLLPFALQLVPVLFLVLLWCLNTAGTGQRLLYHNRRVSICIYTEALRFGARFLHRRMLGHSQITVKLPAPDRR